MTAIEKLISVARAEVGYREKKSPDQLDDKTANAGSGNYTKYARDLDALTDFYNGPKNGYAWCDVFVDWCFYKAFGADLAKKLLCQPDRSAGAGCTYSARYFKNKGQLHTAAPRPGDQIFFGTGVESTHTGLVTAVDGSRVYTVEGNSSDGVQERSYALEAANICGYGRPDWSLAGDTESPAEDSPEPPPAGEEDSADTSPLPPLTGEGDHIRGGGVSLSVSVSLPELYRGSAGEAVRAMQLLLIGRGFACGPDGADGDFGPNTDTALRRFQSARGLDADGICGVHTWTSLIG